MNKLVEAASRCHNEMASHHNMLTGTDLLNRREIILTVNALERSEATRLDDQVAGIGSALQPLPS